MFASLVELIPLCSFTFSMFWLLALPWLSQPQTEKTTGVSDPEADLHRGQELEDGGSSVQEVKCGS